MPSTTTQAAPVSEYAIIVSPEDNLAVVKRETAPGLALGLPGGEVPALAEEHKHREFQFWAGQTVSL